MFFRYLIVLSFSKSFNFYSISSITSISSFFISLLQLFSISISNAFILSYLLFSENLNYFSNISQ